MNNAHHHTSNDTITIKTTIYYKINKFITIHYLLFFCLLIIFEFSQVYKKYDNVLSANAD